jgi:hypothetical protein
MGQYDLFRKIVQSNVTSKQRSISQIQNDIIRDFYDSPSYESVKIDNVYYDVHIVDENAINKNPNEKRILSRPSESFHIGDYVAWNNDTWLIKNMDADKKVQCKGIIEKCNNVLKNYDSNGVLHIVPCVISSSITQSDFDYNSGIIIPDGGTSIIVQGNAWTRTYFKNQRFMFGGQAWKCTYINNYQLTDINDSNSIPIIRLIVSIDSISLSGDDKVNNIPDSNQYVYSVSINQTAFEGNIGNTGTLTANVTLNGASVTRDLVWSSSDIEVVAINATTGEYELIALGSATITCALADNENINDTIVLTVTEEIEDTYQVIISPIVTEIYKGESQEYSVFLYLNNVQQVNTFTITPNSTPIDKYNLDVVDGNHFEVTCLNSYSGGDLIISCMNGGYSGNIEITLRGLF